ncbi:MAG: RNA polymerase factor sigma-54 [Desulfomonile tiedjei]|nr:RNA polymerase factor sigma-54 [Desulfomonile tiedjei]
MALEIRQQLRQAQVPIMTPQLQQAIKLLQCNHIEVMQALEQELKENPILEVAAFDESLSEQENDSRSDLKSLEENAEEVPQPEREVIDPDWESYLESYGGDRGTGQKDSSAQRPLENMASYSETLFHSLVRQLQLSPIERDDRRIALQLIGNVDEHGYLDIDLQTVAVSLGVELERVERVLTEVQKFDPTGIAARNLRECLLLQARVLEEPSPLAVQILEEAFEQFKKGRLDQVARKLKVSLEDIKQASKVICSLNPKPGSSFHETDTIYVVPDIYVIKVGNDYSVVLNDDGVPRLRISPFYQRELHSGMASPAARDYIQEKMRAAAWLIKSIHQRQRTIYKVTQSIIKFQKEFFDKGIDYLRPLILRDVANDVEMHESTISRVTTNKYVHTPRGIFELKYFFNSGIRHGNDSIASESVKNQILRIVKGENRDKPASDKQIADELARYHIHIARRTVAKYRELLGIPPSSERRQKF